MTHHTTEQTHMQEITPEDVREKVAQQYAAAVNAATGDATCCGPAQATQEQSCCGPSLVAAIEQAEPGGIAKAIGYTEEQLASLPEDAVNAAFGCGNPVNMARLQPGETVLDLGSGAGIDVILAAKAVGPEGRVIGIDMTDDMIAKARQNIAEAGISNAEIRRGIIEELPVESGTVDWMLSNCVINLSPEKEKVFAEAYRVLKPGGQFLVSDIVVGDIPREIREDVMGYASCVGGAVQEEEYLHIIRTSGFEDVRIVLHHPFMAAELRSFGTAEENIPRLEGKITSIKVYARKAA